MTLQIDTSDELSYEYLQLCISEFENACIENHSRASALALANGSTYLSDVVLNAHERSLKRVDESRKSLNKTKDQNSNEPASSQGLQLVDADIDLADIFGKPNSPLANYIEDCIGCSLRLKFDWQLKPLDLLGPINAFLDQLNLALDNLLGRIDPWKILQDLCWALDHLKTLCPQDIILVLLSLKALLKRYLLQMFNIKLDWTTLVGPLLQALISAITDLLNNIISILLAPLDCVTAGMRAANDLLHASEQFIASMKSAGTQIDSFFDNLSSGDAFSGEFSAGPLYKDATWNTSNTNKDPLAFFNNPEQQTSLTPGAIGYDPGRLNVSTSIGPSEKPEDALRIPAGFVLKSNQTISEVLKDPTFINSTWLEKLIIPVEEAIAWIRETYQKFIAALESIQGLVGGGISLNLENIGILLFLEDMISIVLLIIRLLSSNLNVKDWCSFLEDNPQVLQDQLRSTFGIPNVDVQKRSTGDLLLKQGPDIVGVVKTCVNARNDSENSALKQWISELELRRGPQ